VPLLMQSLIQRGQRSFMGVIVLLLVVVLDELATVLVDSVVCQMYE